MESIDYSSVRRNVQSQSYRSFRIIHPESDSVSVNLSFPGNLEYYRFFAVFPCLIQKTDGSHIFFLFCYDERNFRSQGGEVREQIGYCKVVINAHRNSIIVRIVA